MELHPEVASATSVRFLTRAFAKGALTASDGCRETRLFTCHDYAPGGREYAFETTVGEELASNKHVKEGVEEAQFVSWRAERDATLGLPRLFVSGHLVF